MHQLTLFFERNFLLFKSVGVIKLKIKTILLSLFFAPACIFKLLNKTEL